MSAAKTRTLRVLVRIRTRRQESLDEACVDAQLDLKKLTTACEEAAQRVGTAEASKAAQHEKIEQLTTSGNRFQIGHYLEQQDYLATLQGEAHKLMQAEEQAQKAMQMQAEVLKQARRAAAHNTHQRERLEEQLQKILQSMDSAELDRQDEEAEEAITARTRRQHEKAHAEALQGDHV